MSVRVRIVVVMSIAWAVVALAAGAGEKRVPTPRITQVDPNGAVLGRVVDAAGAPVAGARLALHAGASAANGDDLQRLAVVRRGISDAAGRFDFGAVPPGDYAVSAARPAFKTTVVSVAVRSSRTTTVDVTMLPGRPDELVFQKTASDVSAAPPPAPAPPAPTAPIPRAAAEQMAAQSGGGGRRVAGGVAGGIAGPTRFGQESDRGVIRRPWPGDLPNTEDYAHLNLNPFRLTTDDALSTFAADVDTASYTNTRRFLTQGQLPPVDAVRVEEFVNYFHYDYPDPSGDHPVSVTTEVGAAPWAPDHRLVLVGVKAQPIDQRRVSDRNIVLLIDVSGSMGSPNKLPLARTALRMFVDTLRDDDRIAIVVYAGASGLVLPSTSGRQRARIHDAIENLHAGGSTNGAQGLQLAYKVAEQEFVEGGVNRVLLLTDGDFNVGLTSQSELLHLIEEKKRTGIFLSVLGLGTGNLKDSTMEMLADKGNGHYAYLDSLHEARRVLVHEGGATLETVAKDVKFQVEFNPATVQAWKLIGYENRLLAHQDFNDDTKDGGELGAGHTVTVLYEVVPTGVDLPAELRRDDGRPVVDDLTYQSDRRPTGNSRDLLTVKIRYKAPDEDTSRLLSRAVRDGDSSRTLPLAASVAEFGLLLRDEDAEIARFEALRDRLRALPVRAEDAADRQGLLDLVELATSLRRLMSGPA